MLNFRRNKKKIPKYLKQNNATLGQVPSAPNGKMPRAVTQADLEKAHKNITRQAILAGLTVVLTIVILFAMTSAWYTNIVHTSGLVFEAESWGFDGVINVDETPTIVAPGDNGAVHLEVQNETDSISAISVNVNKTEMQDEMQKRLFLYVDTHMNRDGETMDRVYVNSRESYTYTVFANGKLTLTEKISNAPQLKWQWVYDVLGYYVVAQTTSITNSDGTVTQKTTVQEYLRPIEYDYDAATFVYKEDANGTVNMVLTTVDGIRSPEAFLQQLSAKDGYEGVIDPAKKTKDGYYPVAIDKETGYGVYAYLCNYAQIQQATEYDTKLGELAYKNKKDPASLSADEKTMLRHKATLNISAQKNESTAINVTTIAGLEDAINKYNADVVQLSEDIIIPTGKSLVVPQNTRVMVDLNGHTIKCESTTGIQGHPGSSLTMINGSLEGSGTYGIYAKGAEVVMSNVNVDNFKYGIYVGDHNKDNPLDSRVHMSNCTVNATDYAVYITGNGPQSVQKTQLLVENTTLTSKGVALISSGNTECAGTDIQIYKSKLIQTDEQNRPGAGIYHPQKNSSLVISDSEITGYTAVMIKAGNVEITDSRITGTGIETVGPEIKNSGCSDTADAVYIETGYNEEINLVISGDSVLTTNSDNAKSLSFRVFEENTPYVSVKLCGGTYEKSQNPQYIPEGYAQSSEGGKFVIREAKADRIQ